MIGGRWDWPSPRRDPSLDVYILDTHLLPPATSHPIENPLPYLRKGPSLRAPKIDPTVISLLGKVYVLPNSFDPSSSDKDEPRAEVLDPCSNEWVSLPEPKLDPCDDHEPSAYKGPVSWPAILLRGRRINHRKSSWFAIQDPGKSGVKSIPGTAGWWILGVGRQ
ncbi:hypothetical protein CRG98_043036 [Punica granatum]|uniref:Uncharacterized protein n=1 Tax=Punica granatum TaxID=22663 RepID=A0A2I0HY00_PUNGR|nr:hypothetical protein CRG98_043036 [Punica granatum]